MAVFERDRSNKGKRAAKAAREKTLIDGIGEQGAGKVAGTLVTADELSYWLEKGVQFFYVHSDPFLRLGLNGIKKSLGR